MLDISLHDSEELIQKYQLKLDDAILAENHHLPLYNEMIQNCNAEYIAGGATQVTSILIK